MNRVRGLAGFFAALAIGLLASSIFGLHRLVTWPGYFPTVTVLLAVGLLASTSHVSIDELRRNGTRVIIAVSAGVAAKAAIISGIMFLAFRQPAYLVLGVAVAQIDPLSTAADPNLRRLSARARSLLSSWASFDDPVTTVLAVYLSIIVLRYTEEGSAAGSAAETGALWSFAGSVVLAGAAYLVWRFFLRRSAQPEQIRERRRRVAVQAAALLVLAGLVAIGVAQFWMLGVALIGLFFRPAIATRHLPAVTRVAFLVAAFVLGLTLVGGVDVLAGLLLGAAAYAAQIIVGLLVATGLPTQERVHIALGQQNGITAIILALVLEPSFPGTIGVVAPAILCINLLHAAANAGWDKWTLKQPPPQPGEADGGASPASVAPGPPPGAEASRSEALTRRDRA